MGDETSTVTEPKLCACGNPILLGADRGREQCARCETAAGLDPWRWSSAASSQA